VIEVPCSPSTSNCQRLWHSRRPNNTIFAEGRDFLKTLYNGKFFAYGSQLNGSGRADAIMFSGMLAGQMLSRHAGFGDVSRSRWLW
jgi:hypothetical protein